MGTRLELHEILCDILGARNVYFQPPESVMMVYPCIRYSRDTIDTKFADNTKYAYLMKYKVIAIDKDPDSDLMARVHGLDLCQHDRYYVADGLHHDVFELYF